jgi:hypothetical protein
MEMRCKIYAYNLFYGDKFYLADKKGNKNPSGGLEGFRAGKIIPSRRNFPYRCSILTYPAQFRGRRGVGDWEGGRGLLQGVFLDF